MKVARIASGPKDREQTKAFLKELCELAVKEGADDAADIDCRGLSFVKRAGRPPEAPPEKQSLHWPEPLFPKDDLALALRTFQHAVVFRIDYGKREGDPSGREQDRREALLKVYTIVSGLESASFYGGYHLALGLAAGNCREVFCSAEEKCRALKKGSPCRYPLRARVSMEAGGLDLKEIAVRAGWMEPGEDFVMGMVFVD